MPSTRELRRRIKSIKNTSQITRAMEMVAATKMRKAQAQAVSGRPYSVILHHSLSQLINKSGEISNPLVASNESEKVGIILLSTDKSLCGALNTNLFRKIMGSDLKLNLAVFYTLGRKGRDFVVRSENQLEADFINQEIVHFKNATQLRKLVAGDFLSGKIGQVYILYPHFVSTLSQVATLLQIIPIKPAEILEPTANNGGDFLFDVSRTSLLEYLLTHHLDIQIFQAILETKAAEHSARMITMKNATDNAKELVSDLSLTYNGVRQDAITSELAEITTAGMALE